MMEGCEQPMGMPSPSRILFTEQSPQAALTELSGGFWEVMTSGL